eukprot:11276429-Alexandrium_andersonii.AAC.1
MLFISTLPGTARAAARVASTSLLLVLLQGAGSEALSWGWLGVNRLTLDCSGLRGARLLRARAPLTLEMP